MKLLNIKELQQIGVYGGIVAVALLLFLGLSGALSAVGIILLLTFPTYLVLSNFDLAFSERLIFGFFIGVGIFSSLTYWIGRLVSFRIAIFVTFILLIAVAYIFSKRRKH